MSKTYSFPPPRERLEPITTPPQLADLYAFTERLKREFVTGYPYIINAPRMPKDEFALVDLSESRVLGRAKIQVSE